jgi:hypothetical protein
MTWIPRQVEVLPSRQCSAGQDRSGEVRRPCPSACCGPLWECTCRHVHPFPPPLPRPLLRAPSPSHVAIAIRACVLPQVHLQVGGAVHVEPRVPVRGVKGGGGGGGGGAVACGGPEGGLGQRSVHVLLYGARSSVTEPWLGGTTC